MDSSKEMISYNLTIYFPVIEGIDEDLSLDTEKDAQVLVFEAGQKSQQVHFTIKNDEISELDETFLLIFMDSDCCVQVENNLTAKVIIVDNDRGNFRVPEVLHNSCNMGTHVLPDMYTLIPWACGPRDLGVHIRQNTHAHVTTIS